jgi:hypothetical protein
MTFSSSNSPHRYNPDVSVDRREYRNSSDFRRSGKNRPCPICGRTKDGDCSISNDGNWVGCHTYIDGHSVPGWHYTKPARNGFQGEFVKERTPEFVKSQRPQQTRHFYYPTRDGELLVRAVRIDLGNGKKKNWLEYWSDGKWLSGCPSNIRQHIPIYRYAEVRAAHERGENVFLVEGEPIVDALWSLGIPATTTIGGCGGYHNYGNYHQDLAGIQLILTPDRDEKGLAYIANFENDFPNQIVGYYLAGTAQLWRQPAGGMDIFDDILDRNYTKTDLISRVIDSERYLDCLNWSNQPKLEGVQKVSGELNSLAIRAALTDLLDRELPTADYQIELAHLAKQLKQPVTQLGKVAESLGLEQVRIANRAATKVEIERLLASKKLSVDIYQILPQQLARPIALLAASMGHSCEPYILYLLTGIGGMLHSESQIKIKSTYYQPGNLYGAVVGASGHRKSPVQQQMLTKPLDLIQRSYNDIYQQEYNRYEVEQHLWDNLTQEKKQEVPQPQPPHRRRVYLNNITMEAIENVAAQQPEQSAIYLKDELKAIFSSANAHRGGKGDDTEKYLSYYDGQKLSRERAGSGFTYSNHDIRFATIGTIQPAVLRELVGNGTDDNGLMSRFLYASLNYTFTPLIDDGEVDASEMLAGIYRQVNGFPATTYKLTTAAFNVFAQAFDSYGRNAIDPAKGSWEQNTWAKAGGQLARLCLNLHLAWGSIDGRVEESIQPEIVGRAIPLMQYFISQALNIIAEQSRSLPPQLVKALEIATAKGGVTPRELCQYTYGPLKPQNTGQAREWLNELGELGYGSFARSGKTSRFVPSVEKS